MMLDTKRSRRRMGRKKSEMVVREEGRVEGREERLTVPPRLDSPLIPLLPSSNPVS
jgi:hypothetical protein